jgi:hypothetical protein
MANSPLSPTVITRKALMILHQKCNFIGSINRQYDEQFGKSGNKIGSSLTIRKPNQFTVRSGATRSNQDVTEASTTLTVSTMKGVDIAFTSQELSLTIDDFAARYLDPAMARLAAEIEADAISMYKDVWNLYDGDAAAFSFTSVANARELLTKSLAPLDQRTMLLNNSHATKFMIDTKGLFHASENISKQYRDGLMGRTGGFDVMENTLLLPHTTGTAAKTTGYLVNGGSQTGATLTVDTGTTSFLVGDVITIAGVYRVHPETKTTTADLQQFVVTANSGTSATSLAISPSIVVSGATQTVSGSPADNAAIVKVGAGASETLTQSLAYHRDAFTFVTAALPRPEGVDFAATEVMDGMAMSIVRDFDISDRSFPCRIDLLYGYKAIRPELAARIHNDG